MQMTNTVAKDEVLGQLRLSGAEYGIVYRITVPTGHIYIGQTTDLHKRLSSYRSGNAHSPALLRLIKSHGWESLVVDCLARAGNQQILNELERWAIAEHRKQHGGLCINTTSGGSAKGNRRKPAPPPPKYIIRVPDGYREGIRIPLDDYYPPDTNDPAEDIFWSILFEVHGGYGIGSNHNANSAFTLLDMVCKDGTLSLDELRSIRFPNGWWHVWDGVKEFVEDWLWRTGRRQVDEPPFSKFRRAMGALKIKYGSYGKRYDLYKAATSVFYDIVVEHELVDIEDFRAFLPAFKREWFKHTRLECGSYSSKLMQGWCDTRSFKIHWQKFIAEHIPHSKPSSLQHRQCPQPESPPVAPSKPRPCNSCGHEQRNSLAYCDRCGTLLTVPPLHVCDGEGKRQDSNPTK